MNGRTRDARLSTSRARCGVTLLELMITLALLAILAGVAGLSINHGGPAHPVDACTARLAAARDEALRSGHAVSVTLVDSANTSSVATAYPDGRVLAEPSVGLNPLTGRVREDAPHGLR